MKTLQSNKLFALFDIIRCYIEEKIEYQGQEVLKICASGQSRFNYWQVCSLTTNLTPGFKKALNELKLIRLIAHSVVKRKCNNKRSQQTS